MRRRFARWKLKRELAQLLRTSTPRQKKRAELALHYLEAAAKVHPERRHDDEYVRHAAKMLRGHSRWPVRA